MFCGVYFWPQILSFLEVSSVVSSFSSFWDPLALSSTKHNGILFRSQCLQAVALVRKSNAGYTYKLL